MVNEDIAAFVQRQVKGGTVEQRESRYREREHAQPRTKPPNWVKPLKTQISRVEECHCETCGNTFQEEVSTYQLGGRELTVLPWECPTCKEQLEAEAALEREEYLKEARVEQREKWRKQTGIPEHLLTRSTFKDFEPGYQDKALRNCRRYAEGFNLDDPRGYRSLILYSPSPGVGKTHLTVAIANYAIDHWNGEPEVDRWGAPATRCPIRFEKGPGLVLRVRRPTASGTRTITMSEKRISTVN